MNGEIGIKQDCEFQFETKRQKSKTPHENIGGQFVFVDTLKLCVFVCVCVCACKGVTPNKLGLARESQKSTTAVVCYKISYWSALVAMPRQFPHLVEFIADGTCFSWLRHVLTHIPMQRCGETLRAPSLLCEGV